MKSLLISVLSIVLFSCATYEKKNNYICTDSKETVIKNSYFSDTTVDYVYRAKINIYKKNFSGIFIVKKISELEHRVVFTTEMGSKIFDFSYKSDDFTVNFILEEMDKKILINILKKDFKVLITDNIPVMSNYNTENNQIQMGNIYNKKHFFIYKENELQQVDRVGYKKEKVQFFYSNINSNIAKSILIKHRNINLTINLKQI